MKSLSREIKVFGLIVLPFIGTACATLPTYQPVQLPAFASEYFSDCRKRDGAVSFSLNRNGQEGERIDAEWASRPNGDWSLATYSPFGQTLLQISYLHLPLSLNVKAKQSTALDALSVDKQGFINFQGQRLGLKAEELGCLLEMKLPRTWLRQVVSQEQGAQGLAVQIADSERHLLLRLGPHGSTQDWLWNFDVRWNRYWGLREESINLQLLREPRLVLTSESYPELSGHMTLNKESQ